VTAHRAWALVLLWGACAETGSPPPRAAFVSLRYDDGPPPADASNRYGDDAAAAALGHKLYFEPALSGPLLDPDNGALAGSLGANGTPGLVACASCHVPTTGFVDTRSPGQQISLAAQWTARKSPALLESGFVSLFNWDGGRDSMWRQTIGVMESNHEFNASRLFVAEQVFRLYRAEYEAIFGAMPPLDDTTRFPALSAQSAGCVRSDDQYICHGVPGDGAEYDTMMIGLKSFAGSNGRLG